jgi:hypothetical protein
VVQVIFLAFFLSCIFEGLAFLTLLRCCPDHDLLSYHRTFVALLL